MRFSTLSGAVLSAATVVTGKEMAKDEAKAARKLPLRYLRARVGEMFVLTICNRPLRQREAPQPKNAVQDGSLVGRS